MSFTERAWKSCLSWEAEEAHPERRPFPFVPTLIGTIMVLNVASVIMTLAE